MQTVVEDFISRMPLEEMMLPAICQKNFVLALFPQQCFKQNSIVRPVNLVPRKVLNG